MSRERRALATPSPRGRTKLSRHLLNAAGAPVEIAAEPRIAEVEVDHRQPDLGAEGGNESPVREGRFRVAAPDHASRGVLREERPNARAERGEPGWALWGADAGVKFNLVPLGAERANCEPRG